jgi:hypothetical protein
MTYLGRPDVKWGGIWGGVRRMEGPKGCEARSEANPGMCRPRRGNAQILLILLSKLNINKHFLEISLD